MRHEAHLRPYAACGRGNEVREGRLPMIHRIRSAAAATVVVLLGGCVPGVSLDQLEGGNSTDADTADGDSLPPDTTDADARDDAADTGDDIAVDADAGDAVDADAALPSDDGVAPDEAAVVEDVGVDEDTPYPPCGGTLADGHCWYLAGYGQDCDGACADHCGYDEATRTFAGSDGTNANCAAVFDAMHRDDGTTTDDVTGEGAIGCYLASGDRPSYWERRRRAVTPATTSSAAPMGLPYRRICACGC
jgi:hypothetical protein